ncbi:hypothetical protein [Brevundimonas denitrificans]|uniref:hypothetical protein n=1 Tax=Brevundimonas denitrificans TaxID=1443434 RepID=UPI00352FD9D4
MAVGAHLVLATVLRGEEMILLPVLVALYLVGRVFFALGYARARPRAPSAWPSPAPPRSAPSASPLSLSGWADDPSCPDALRPSALQSGMTR